MVFVAAGSLNREQSRRVDEIAIEQFGMSGLVLMENAGRGCADELVALGIDGPVVICCGKGNNGGDGYVIARHLDARGFVARVMLCCDAEELTGDAAENHRILSMSSVPTVPFDERAVVDQLSEADWIVDALLGTGAQGEPRPPLDQVIRRLNECPAKKLAIDLPSGLDCDSGEPSASTFRADHTLTFVAPKVGFAAPQAKSFVGDVHVLGIGVPRDLLAMISDS